MELNNEPYPSHHREQHIKEVLATMEEDGAITDGWSVEHNEDGNDWVITFRLTLPTEAAEHVMGASAFRALQTGWLIGFRDGVHEGGKEKYMRLEEGEAHSLLHSMASGNATTVHLTANSALPMLEISAHVCGLILQDGTYVEISDAAFARLHDLLIVRHDAVHHAYNMGLTDEEGEDEEASADRPEAWVFDMLRTFVAYGWIDAWEDQPDNGAGCIALWRGKTGRLHANEDGSLDRSVGGSAGAERESIALWEYSEVPTAIHAFRAGREMAAESMKKIEE